MTMTPEEKVGLLVRMLDVWSFFCYKSVDICNRIKGPIIIDL
jgi:hypothetical protein